MTKKSVLLQIRTPHQNTVLTGSVTNYCDKYFSGMLQTKVVFILKFPKNFEEYKSIILPLCANYFCLSLALLTGLIRFKKTPAFRLL